MKNNNYLYIEDERKEKFHYIFTPAALISNFVPLIVVLDSEDKILKTAFEYKMWNILILKNRFSKATAQKLVNKIIDEHECENYLYFYGACSDALQTVELATSLNANALFSDISLLGSQEQKRVKSLACAETSTLFYLCEKESREAFCKMDENSEINRLKTLLNMFEKMAF